MRAWADVRGADAHEKRTRDKPRENTIAKPTHTRTSRTAAKRAQPTRTRTHAYTTNVHAPQRAHWRSPRGPVRGLAAHARVRVGWRWANNVVVVNKVENRVAATTHTHSPRPTPHRTPYNTRAGTYVRHQHARATTCKLMTTTCATVRVEGAHTLSPIHILRCRRIERFRFRWSQVQLKRKMTMHKYT